MKLLIILKLTSNYEKELSCHGDQNSCSMEHCIKFNIIGLFLDHLFLRRFIF